MTAAEAEQLLRSNNYHDRLKAARFFAADPQPPIAPLLIEALAKEQVVPVKRVLAQALASLNEDNAPDAIARLTVEDRETIRRAALIEATGTVLHEIGPIVGLALVKAGKEIADFEDSETRRELKRLAALLEAFREWNKAAREPKSEEFDLAELIKKVVVVELETIQSHDLRVELTGRSPFLTTGDQLLIELALSNGLRNALEASKTSAASKTILIAWEETPQVTWLAVLDRGPGLPPGGKHGEIGISTKRGHFGMGLAVANQAVQSLGGTLSLQPRSEGGVRYEFSWPRKLSHENAIG
jgi:signal transduction histidine kinase